MINLTPSLSRRNFEVGYALYSAGLEISHCQNDDQRKGWNNALRGEMAASAVEGIIERGGSPAYADECLKKWGL